ncbi:MAG: hypothetical protein ACRDGN_01470, partial [bacterium]
DWLRNIHKTTSVIITTGRRHFPAMPLPISETRLVLLEYAQRHPLAFRALSKLLIGRPLRATAEDFERLARLVPVIACTLATLSAKRVAAMTPTGRSGIGGMIDATIGGIL